MKIYSSNFPVDDIVNSQLNNEVQLKYSEKVCRIETNIAADIDIARDNSIQVFLELKIAFLANFTLGTAKTKLQCILIVNMSRYFCGRKH